MFKIRYDSRVKDYVASLSSAMRKRIREAIMEKLVEHPEIYGKPLRHSLAGFRGLRVGSYRIIFLIRKKNEVFILLIAHRKNAYKEITKRH